MARANQCFHLRDLAVASSDSWSHLRALGSDFGERAAIARERRFLAGILLPPAKDAVAILRVDFHEARLAAASLAANLRGAGTAKQVHHDVAGLAAIEQCTLYQLDRLGRGVDAICGRLLLVP